MLDGKNLSYCLTELGNSADLGAIEMYFEDGSGNECVEDIEISEMARAANSRICALESVISQSLNLLSEGDTEGARASLASALGGQAQLNIGQPPVSVLTYRSRGHTRPCGTTIGANGAGDYAVVYYGDADVANQHAKGLIQGAENGGHRLSNVMLVDHLAGELSLSVVHTNDLAKTLVSK